MGEVGLSETPQGCQLCSHTNPCSTYSDKPHFPFCALHLHAALEKALNLDVKINQAGLKQTGQPSPCLRLPFELVAFCHPSGWHQGAQEEPTVSRQTGDGCQRDQKSKQTGYPSVLWFRGKVQAETAGQNQGCMKHHLFAVKSGTTEGIHKKRVRLRVLRVVWLTVSGKHHLTHVKNI